MKKWAVYINGEWIQTDETMNIENPATKEVFATVPKGGAKEAEAAVDAAHEALSGWSSLTAYERADYLEKWHALIKKNETEIGKLMTMEQGKPVKEATGEVGYANSFIKWYAEEGKRIYGETIPASASNKRLFVIKQPVGVIAAITPWNFPAAMITRKVGPALAAGCTAVVKPASSTPLTALRLAELAEEAGIPKGVLNVITGSSREISETWMADERVKKLSFTGSTEVGKTLMKGSADTMKKISLELGGHAPFIVMDDADLDGAAKAMAASKFRNSGQTCICTNRAYVHEAVYDEFMEKFKEEVFALKVGNGMDEGVSIGPLIDDDGLQKVKDHIEDAERKGGVIFKSPQKAPDSEGYYIEPVIIGEAADDMLCMNEETFGPVAPVTKVKDMKEAIQRANQSPFGLAAYVYTENISKGIQLVEALHYGIVGLNDGLPSTAQAPFGGMKESGLGREGGRQGIEEYLEVKYVSLGLKM
ncbi:NAD-dependent succinate-semialdehyde dehydrogenase [Bacillus sp. FJAT-42376]|uniref:NAD-dependent succinate-semialdehyde dehydrogenase n=1 Tax=Bacillus sp. FJAT-42376 TaxID=2014076 RepID=UPI000F50DDF8|nr:NAD-dependent succinate-semialdehyde dehydrogenase [Bacillus sp. FJAT-42376]AZB42748.1 NAD-dependent succinate-semialdehyde dehydrogenase [Bacillus sp. FJAT-42376]